MRMIRMAMAIFAMMVMFSCKIVPQKIPPTPGDNLMIEKLRHDIKFNSTSSGWGWILWYIPVLFIAVAWGHKEFIAKKPKCPDETPKQPKESSESLTADKNEPSGG